jgi:hypothetical protein
MGFSSGGGGLDRVREEGATDGDVRRLAGEESERVNGLL